MGTIPSQGRHIQPSCRLWDGLDADNAVYPCRSFGENGMDSLVNVFGNRLRAIREAAGFTQEQLGQAAELDYKHIGSIERGEKTPSFEAVERLAGALKVDYYELFLPDDLLLGRTDKDLKVLVREIESHGSPQLKQFLRQVLAAGREMTRPQ